MRKQTIKYIVLISKARQMGKLMNIVTFLLITCYRVDDKIYVSEYYDFLINTAFSTNLQLVIIQFLQVDIMLITAM